MIQLVLSILVSVGALAYHIHAVPYRETWLNMMQGACLFFIWLTLQAGAMVQNTLPDRNTGDAILVALSVANIVMLVSPVLLGLIAALQVLPQSIRRRVSVFFVGAEGTAEDKPGAERGQSDDAPQDVEGWETIVLPPRTSAEHDAAGAAAAEVDADATHIELAALNADTMQPADLDAWRDNAAFGAARSAVPAVAEASAQSPAAEEHQ